MKTLIDVLLARKDDENQFLSFFTNGSLSSKFSYLDIYRDAKKKASKISKRIGSAKAIVLIEGNNDYDFITNFFATQMSGNVPVPVTTHLWITEDYYLNIIKSILETTHASLFLTSHKAQDILSKFDNQLEYIFHTEWDKHAAQTDFKVTLPKEEDLAFIQFSSGSTGNPKGVKLTQANVVANIEQISNPIHKEDGTNNGVSWLPVHHDMGLIGGFLVSFYKAYNIALMTPYDFAVNPSRWLRVITETKANFIVAPNSGYHLTTKRVKKSRRWRYDLSHVRVALCGAEPINVKTLKGFTEAFDIAGFKESAFVPCYGMAENTLAITFHQGTKLISETISKEELYNSSLAVPVYGEHDIDDTITFISSGKPLEGVEIRILDSDSKQLKDRGIGEIVIKGPSTTSGYYNRPDINKDLFVDGYLRTGDLGYFSNNELFITGRKKDVIIINGLNINAEEIECQAITYNEVRAGRLVAFSKHNPATDSEEICLLVETKSALKYLKPKRRLKMRANLAAHLSKFIAIKEEQIHIVAPGTILKTTSGKVKRNAMKQLLEEGKIKEETFAQDFFQYKLIENKIKSKLLIKDMRNDISQRIVKVLSAR
jgi:fatty-acyl-CoA synthase